MSGRTFVISFVSVLVVAGALSSWVMMQGASEVGINQAGIGLQKVQYASAMWAEDHGGLYPEHVALLEPNNYFRAELLNDPRFPDEGEWLVGGVDSRPYMREMRGDKQARGEALLDRGPLLDAIASVGDAATYRLGGYWFVRLVQTHEHPSLVFGWTLPDERGRRFVVYDSGDARRINDEDWEEVWRLDAQARIDLGLPPLAPPD